MTEDNRRALLVEDSRFLGQLFQREIEKRLNVEVIWVETYRAAEKLLNRNGPSFFISLLDINLPDAPRGEIVDLVLANDIPAIVFTGEFSNEVRNRIWSKRVVDYVLKEGMHNVNYIVSLIERIDRNRRIKVLVVDDSKVSRTYVSELLKVHKYQILEASDGREALNVMMAHPDIRMVITDHYMPNMDGFQLVRSLRKDYNSKELAVIGISARGNNMMSAQFLKNGANDFLTKPFLSEEFYCRIAQNIEIIEYVEKIREMSNKDFLTSLYNRRYFFEIGRRLFGVAERQNMGIIIAMADIDHFKNVNDVYGHDAGDAVLVRISRLIENSFRKTDIVSRHGGEEFCILATHMAPAAAFDHFERLRRKVEETVVSAGANEISVTVSIGVCTRTETSLDDMVTQADMLLYKAKNTGRNKICTDRPEPSA